MVNTCVVVDACVVAASVVVCSTVVDACVVAVAVVADIAVYCWHAWRWSLLLHPVDEDAFEHTHLRRGQPDPERISHQLTHPRDLGPQRVIEAVHGPGAGAEDRIAELAHVGEGGRAACGNLGIELLLLLILLGLDLEGLLCGFVFHASKSRWRLVPSASIPQPADRQPRPDLR